MPCGRPECEVDRRQTIKFDWPSRLIQFGNLHPGHFPRLRICWEIVNPYLSDNGDKKGAATSCEARLAVLRAGKGTRCEPVAIRITAAQKYFLKKVETVRRSCSCCKLRKAQLPGISFGNGGRGGDGNIAHSAIQPEDICRFLQQDQLSYEQQLATSDGRRCTTL